MAQTIEAEVAADGTVRLFGPVQTDGRPRRALVVVLDEPAPVSPPTPPRVWPPFEPRDEWERRLLGLAVDTGVSPPPGAFGREELYD